MNKRFLITSDITTKNTLLQLGFIEVPNSNIDIFVFVNDSKLSFANDIDVSKIKYSNKLFY